MRSRNDGEPHKGWTDHLGRFPCSPCSLYSSAFSVAVVLSLLIMPLLLVDGGVVQTGLVLPEHVNHTLIGRPYSVEDFVVRVISVGDVTGSRQIMLWLELTNNVTGPEDVVWVVLPGFMKVQVDGGEWRPVYYCWMSEVDHGETCAHYRRLVYRHRSYNLNPGEGIGCWVVFELSKYEFDTMNSISFECPTPGGKITGGFEISEERVPSYVPYIDMIRPRDGEVTPWLGSIRFQVLDLESHPVNWSAELDGEFLFSGSAPARTDPCPTVVERSLEKTPIRYGPHSLIVEATDGTVSETVSVNFLLEEPEATELSVEWTVNTSSIFHGYIFGSGRQGTQTVWDIDGDGVNEIIFGTCRGDSKRLWCFDANTNLEWVYPEMGEEGLPGDPMSKVSLVDIDLDGIYELVLGGRGGRLHVLDGDGHVVWTWDSPGSAFLGAPQAYDVDGDGYVDFFLNDNSGYIHRLSHIGELVWSVPVGWYNGGHPTIADLDRDGRYEVLFTSNDGYVYCLDATRGNEKWRFNAGYMMSATVIVADVNRDGEYEAITWSDFSGVVCISSHGELVWRWMLPQVGRIALSQAMGDVDKDGSMDLVVMSSVGMFGIDIGGVEPITKWEINVSEWSEQGLLPTGSLVSRYSSYQLIADIDGDDELEILWLAPFPIVTDGATGRLEAFYINDHIALGRPADNGGWWGDVDGDGVSEWICELKGKSFSRTLTYCLTLGGRFPAESPWPEYYHSAYPAEYQNQQDWLTLKAAYSNSLWFPIHQSGTLLLVLLLFLIALQTWEDIRRC